MIKSTANILIVDDEAQNRKLLVALLGTQGYLTRCATNGHEALTAVAEQMPDLILLDIMMPGMDGYQVAKTLKADPVTSHVPIIMVTAVSDRGARLSGLDAGAEEFLTKPIDRAELWLRVRNLLRLKAYGDLLQDHGALLAARHAAVLNALPAHIALLDPAGRILSVNDAWRQFAEENAPANCSPAEVVGSNYLEVCDQAYGADAAESAKAAAGIRAVLEHSLSSFSLEYPCHSPTEQRWFLLAVAPMHDGPSGGAVVMHLDHTAQRVAQEGLRGSERRFLDLLDNVDFLAVMLDCEGRITYCNEFLLLLTGWHRDEVIGRDWFAIFMPIDRGDRRQVFQAMLAGMPGTSHLEGELLTRTGEARLVRWNNTLLRSIGGDVVGTASIGEDITERRESDLRIAHLSRVSAVLSSINSLIVRAKSRVEMYVESCRILVGVGGFEMAMIGILNADTGIVTVVASEGVDIELRSAMQDVLASPHSVRDHATMTGRAIAQKCPIVANDSRNDERVVHAAHYVGTGVRSVAVLPLIVDDQVLGVLGLYATEVNFFGDDELRLLNELADDIAFAIGHIDKQDRLTYLAHYDPLTGMANRGLFQERLQQKIGIAGEHGPKLFVVLLNLERFRAVNDSLGRAAGDALLAEVAARMARHGVDVDRMSRFDADRFAVMVYGVPSDSGLERLLEQRNAQIFGPPFHVGGAELRISARYGIAIFPEGGKDAESLIKSAEAAVQEARRRGERYQFYAESMNLQFAQKLALENQLRRALENHEFVLHYQAKHSLRDGKLSGVEALIRWNDPRTGLVPPAKFIPVLEETGMIHDVGRWALRQAIDDYARWRSAGLSPVRIAVNVSPLQLRNRGFIDEIRLGLGTDPHAPAGLELEITESLIMESVEHSISVLTEIRAMGITISIDDFGTGFSSLSHLAKLPVDTLKIDRSFISEMAIGPEGLSLVSTIINLAHSLRLKVVAEGVETEEQSRLLCLLGCDEMQGFLGSRPVPRTEFESRHLGLLETLPSKSDGSERFARVHFN